jgi:hypothetical protein
MRSRRRSPQQMNIADGVVSANMRNFASLTRRDLSRSRTFAAGPLVFVNIGESLAFLYSPIQRRIEGGRPRPHRTKMSTGIDPLRCYLNNLPQELRHFPVGSAVISVRVLCSISQGGSRRLRLVLVTVWCLSPQLASLWVEPGIPAIKCILLARKCARKIRLRFSGDPPGVSALIERERTYCLACLVGYVRCLCGHSGPRHL